MSMQVDLVAGSRYSPVPFPNAAGRLGVMVRRPKVLVFDSGLGGLTVFSEIARLRPDAELVYAADDAGFPYGGWREDDLVKRVVGVIRELIEATAPDAVVIACNTASTLVLPDLRAAFPQMPFVGTVPAIKPAAAQSRSKLISVLATPGTVARDYTRALIQSFATDCAVTLVGSTRLAALAEATMSGQAVEDAAIAEEIAPCFVMRTDDGARTDCIVLACTHYPLLRERFMALAPWPVDWFDPAPAIARRLDHVLVAQGLPRDIERRSSATAHARFTSRRSPNAQLIASLAGYGLSAI